MIQCKLFALLIAVALFTPLCGCDRPSSADPSDGSSASARRVTAAPPQRKTLTQYTTQPARIEAYEETPLYPKVDGYVQEVLVDIGDLVTRDQPLITLWVPEMEDEQNQKEAMLAQADAELQQAAAAIGAAEVAVQTAVAHVTQAQAGIGRAEGEHDLWTEQYTRIEELAASGSVERQLVDETRYQLRAAAAALEEAQANVAAAEAALAEAQANVRNAQAQHVAAQAGLHVAEADLQRTNTLLAYARIKAPFDGVVTSRNVDTGHYVYPASSGATQPLLVVARTDIVRIFVDVPEMEAALVDSGEDPDPATVRVQALGEREFEAAVTRTSWSLNVSNRSLRTEIDIPNTDGLLRPGMYATAVIRLEEHPDAYVLPITAIVFEGHNAFCWCVESGQVERTPVQLGLRVGEEVEVLSGLQPNQVVVLSRADSLQPGQRVEVLAPEE